MRNRMGLMTWSGRGLQTIPQMQAAGLQRLLFPKPGMMGRAIPSRALGAYSWQTPVVMDRMPSIRAQHRAYRGRGLMGADTPWYEAFFTHIENIAPIASSFVLQMMDRRYDQQKDMFDKASSHEREMAYIQMMKDIVTEKAGGKGQLDPQMRTYLYNQFQKEPSSVRERVLSAAGAGDPDLTAKLRAEFSGSGAWFSNPMFLIGGGLAAASVIALLIIALRR